ncbi:MAG TPA: hypothetical protein VF765_20475 [Polyangiaceae bacterium]
MVIAAFFAAGCATGADGDAYWGDEGGSGPVVDGSADEQTDAGTGGAAHEAGGRGSDAAPAQDSGQGASHDAAGVDSSQEDAAQEASAGNDGPADEASNDASEGDGEGDAGADGGTTEGGSSCNAQNCNGCCNGNHCVSGTSNHACGTAGGACQDCSALGDTCMSGTCQAPTGGTCSKTCGGCCDKNDACHAQASAQYCPTNNGGLFQPGGPCEDCTAEGDTQCFLDIIAYVCLP